MFVLCTTLIYNIFNLKLIILKFILTIPIRKCVFSSKPEYIKKLICLYGGEKKNSRPRKKCFNVFLVFNKA